jgi:hypothetical protein
MIRKILLGLLLGLIFTLAQLPHDPFFQRLVTRKFTEFFGNAFDCRLTFKRAYIDIWAPALVLEGVQVTPRVGTGWSWTAKSYSTCCSWWYVWQHKALDLDMCFENLVAESEYTDDGLAIAPHVKKMVLGKPLIPLVVTQLQLLNACFMVNQNGKQLGHFNWNSCTHDRQGILHSKLQLADGSIFLGNQELKQLTADAMVDIAQCAQQPGFTMQGACIIDSNADQPISYTIAASWLCDVGMLDIIGSDSTAIHCALESSKRAGNFCCTVPLVAVKKCAAIAGYTLPELPGSFEVEGQFNYADVITLAANYTVNTRLRDKELHTKGCLNLDANYIMLNGSAHEIAYQAVFDKKQSYLKHAQIFYENLPVCSITGDNKNVKRYMLMADLALANIIGAPLFDRCPLKGRVNAHVALESGSCTIDLSTNQLFILIPSSFYSLKDIKSHLTINYTDRKITIQDSCISFDQGSVQCFRGMVQCDAGYQLESVSLPVMLSKLPIKMDPSVQGSIAGQLAITKIKDKPMAIKGNLILDNGTINALEYAKQMLTSVKKTEVPYPIECDVFLSTRAPICIDAPLLKSNAVLDLHVTNTLNDPHIAGSCALQDASVMLYKPLYVEHAQITFIPGQLAPLINLYATSKIKQYEVMMHVIGALDNYQLIFSSNPFLEQQEIVALLLSGNPKSAVTTLIPTVASQLLLDYVRYAKNSLWQSTRAWLAPLEYVRLVPHFDDQSARGGIRAAIEIAVTDQLTATIQKNFTLTEDTRLQVEYAISDDIAVRATRDERRDLNAEIEARWKF